MSDLFLGLVNDRALLVVFVRLALKCMAGRVAAVRPPARVHDKGGGCHVAPIAHEAT